MKISLRIAGLAAKAMLLLPPETAHRLTVGLLRAGLGPVVRMKTPRLENTVCGLTFPNILGLAAGMDKNAEVINEILDTGFGFTEVGAVTPHPRPGNGRPRVFRLRRDGAVINRYGFNNDGHDAVAERMAARPAAGIVGVNLGAAAESRDRLADYIAGIGAFSGLAGFYTVNVSSPNTPGLRSLQKKDALGLLVRRVLEERDRVAAKTPVFLKIAPDLKDEEKADIVDIANIMPVDALVISNTTTGRTGLSACKNAAQQGGLSGRPLFYPSTELLREFHGALARPLPLVGVGGVFSARDAYAKILAGASLVQLYTGLVYKGPGLPSRILRDLPALLDADGFRTVSDAVGAGNA